jgi:hypothetical protein
MLFVHFDAAEGRKNGVRMACVRLFTETFEWCAQAIFEKA